MKVSWACAAALALGACAEPGAEESAHRVTVEGHSVYVTNATEQEGRAYAVSACRARGGSAVFAEIVSYRYLRKTTKAAKFDCTK